jgi:proteasome alpha subunit
MQSDQQAYDRGVTVFSPDGRLYQVEYAREAVERGSPAVGVTTDDAVVFAAHGPRRSPLMRADSVEKVHDLDGHLAAVTAGHVADGRRLVDAGRQFAQRERLRYGERPDAEHVAKAVADHVQETTQTGGTRPFGAALLVGGHDETGPALYEVDPSGSPTAWHAAAVGAGADDARALLEADHDSDIDRDAGVALALDALAAAVEADLTAAELDVTVLDDTGLDSFDRERRASALDEAGHAAS